MSRGRDANYAYCITEYPRLADVREGSRPAPELQRAQQLEREYAGMPSGEPQPSAAVDPVTVLAGVLARDGSEISATETLERELSRADHLGVLGGIWDDLVRREQHTRFEQALRDALPEDLAEQALGDPACTWLWRSLREAETAGLDGGDVLRQAAGMRSMAGARDVARVLDSRVRRRLYGVQPTPPGPWADRVPDLSSPDLNRYLREVAEAMDDRVRRLGEHAAETPPLWALRSLGPVPPDPAGRADWEQRAGRVAAYRERYGYEHPADPIGPEPAKTSPEARAAWHGALTARGRVDGIDLRGCTDGDLWLRRSTYERETAWAPPHVSEELRLMRLAERDAHVNAVRAEHESHATHDEQAAARHRTLARSYRALQAKATREAAIFSAAQETRRQWETVTETTRRIAIAADAELRRRHPGLRIKPLRPHPAEATGITEQPASSPGDDTWEQLTLDGSAHLVRSPSRGKKQDELTPAQERVADGQLVLGLTPETAHHAIPEDVLRIRENAKIAQAKLDDLTHTLLPGPSEDELSPGLVWPAEARSERDAVLQPPRPEVAPSSQVLQHRRAARISTDHAEPERG
jgi:hypothetical protein